MKDKKNIKFKYYIYAIIPILSFISVAFLSTYAFYLATVVGNEDNGDVVLKSAQVFAVFNASEKFEVEKMLPGYNGELEFSIVNTSDTEDAYGNYTLAWDIITNEINSENFVYTLEGTSEKDGQTIYESDKNKLIKVSNMRRIPSVSSNIGTGMINTGVTHHYVLKVSFLESGASQDDLQDKNFEGKIVAKGDPNI